MGIIKKIASASAAVVMMVNLVNVGNVKAEDEINKPEIVGTYGATISLDTGDLLYGKNEDVQAYPASITKIMTALLMMEEMDEKDKVAIANACANITRSSSQAYYEEGEEMSRDTALYSMLVTSANDLACSIGATIAGSEDKFGEMMTERAKELGAKNTSFVNASGLDDTGHLTTAYDIALITREAFKHEKIRSAMFTKVYEAKTSRQSVELSNKNRINEDKDTLGGKTGFTDNAGNTLVKIDEVDGVAVVNVVMKSQLGYIYDDIKTISNYGVSQLEKYEFEFEEEEEIFGKKVKVKVDEIIELALKNEDDKENVSLEFKLSNELKELEIVKDGVSKGDILGKVEVKYKGDSVKVYDAIATEDVKFDKGIMGFGKNDDGEGMNRSLKALIAILIPVFMYMLLMIAFNKKTLESRRKKK